MTKNFTLQELTTTKTGLPNALPKHLEPNLRTLANDAWAMVPAPASPASPAPEVEVVAAEIPAE